MSAGTRGKSAESEVAKLLEKQSTSSSFAHYRLPDARAGSFKATLADFMYMSVGKFVLLEVKEVDHEFRLPHKNFDSFKVARMKVWAMAGARCFVLVKHSPTGLWRGVPLTFFHNREGGSWDLRQFPATTLDDAFVAGYKLSS